MKEHSDWGGIGNCSSDALHEFHKLVNPETLMRVNVLTFLIAGFMAIFVVGLYMPYYRHRSTIRHFFLVASTLFLPILTYIIANGTTISTLSNQKYTATILPRLEWEAYTEGREPSYEMMSLDCNAATHSELVTYWVSLALLLVIDTTSTIIVADDREGRNNGLPVELFAKLMWTLHIALYVVTPRPSNTLQLLLPLVYIFVLVKVLHNCLIFWLAGRSLAHARNPRFIVGYMMQLCQRDQHDGRTVEQQAEYEKLVPPPLIVMGEGRQKVEKRPQGYFIKPKPREDVTIVTIEKIWELHEKQTKELHEKQTKELHEKQTKDLCFSFALFKLLRCRFAGYTVLEAGLTQVHNFFWHEFLKNDNGAERVFTMIEDELSFLHDYYYTSYPVSYSTSWLPYVSPAISSCTIAYCIFSAWVMALEIQELGEDDNISALGQIYCTISCYETSDIYLNTSPPETTVKFGSLLNDLILVSLLLLLVGLVALRDIGSFIFSTWITVDNICRLVQEHIVHPGEKCLDITYSVWIGCCRFMKLHRMNQMSQCSVLVLHPRYHPALLFAHVQNHLRFPHRSKKVPAVVKAAIINTLRRNNGVKTSGEAFSPRTVEDGRNFIWGCSDDKGVAHTILICHIATSLLELRRPHHRRAFDDEITATHLSKYCAYLVSHAPELLPDDEKWCKSLYKAVKKSSLHVVSGVAAEYEELLALLLGLDEHEVLHKGALLARRLVREHWGREWSVLAEFWTEMILHVASSSTPDKHKEAIAGGAELITLLWALVMHAGPGPAPATAPAAPAPASPTVPAHEPSSVAPSAEIELVILG